MEKYLDLVEQVLVEGEHRENRTGVDTVSAFSRSYSIDLEQGFPLLTTKDLSGFRWNSLIHELLWYFSGQHHIRELREETSIWDAWADENGNLPTAYGRFWRRYPIPEDQDVLEGEWWPTNTEEWKEKAADLRNTRPEKVEQALNRWVNEEDGRKTFDQIKYVIDTLNGENPLRPPESRRLVVNAWHPANAAISRLPPCHFTFVFSKRGGKLDTHLTQRSGDIALGIPFNIAAYSLITKIIASRIGLEPGTFHHTVVDAHIYTGKDERADWYRENLSQLQQKVREADRRQAYLQVRDWLQENAPEQDEPYDHVPNLLKQLSRKPRERPEMEIADKPIDQLEFNDFKLKNYNPYPGLNFEVAE